MPTKFGEDWSNSNELATVFSKLNMAAAAIVLDSDQCAIFQHDIRVLHQIRNNLTKIDKDWFNSKEIANVFQNPRWWQSSSWLLVTVLFLAYYMRSTLAVQHTHQSW